MTLFSFEAYAPDGSLTSGQLEARDQAEALEALRLKGLVPFRFGERRTRALRKSLLQTGKPRLSDIAEIMRAMAVLLEASLPLDTALRLVTGQLANRRQTQVVEALQDAVVGGVPLSEAMALQPQVFAASHIAIVRAGEVAGNIAEAVKDLSQMLERQAELKSRVSAALVYPAILLVMAIAAISLVLFVMAPALTPLFDGRDVPMPFVLAMATSLSVFLREHGTLFGIGTLLAALALMHLLRREAFLAFRDRAALSAPVVGRIAREAETARFARLAGVLLRSGTPMVKALSVTAEAMTNRTCRADLQKAVEALSRGARPTDALAAFGIIPDASRNLIAIGAETNRLPEMLERVADMNEKAFERRIERLMTFLTPALTVGIGVLVGGLILSVMSAILSANDLAI